jgi:2-polyprenyl-3-methyl-5-hydroxy-6-metoxy-1,4-benzoquinol methylase
MDDPGCDPELLRRTYSQFRFVNPFVSGWRTLYRRDIRPFLSSTRPSSLLDVGSGGGDVARSLARWAAREGLRLTVTGIDPDARAHEYATSLPALPGLTFRRALSSQLVAEGAHFDFVVSNHVLHHLSATELGGLLFDSERLCAGGRVLHADIARSRFAYLGFGLATLPFFHGSYIRADGLTSIRRSYTVAELRAAVPPGWSVSHGIPSRLVLRWEAAALRVRAPSPSLSVAVPLPRRAGLARPQPLASQALAPLALAPPALRLQALASQVRHSQALGLQELAPPVRPTDA